MQKRTDYAALIAKTNYSELAKLPPPKRRRRKSAADLIMESHIELTDEFFENVRRHGYPVDLDLVSAIHGSTLSLDIYMFLLHRINLLNKNGYPSTVIQWADLYAMFGSGYKTLRQFVYKAKISFRTIAGYWGTGSKALNYELSREGLVLKPSFLSAMPASSSDYSELAKLPPPKRRRRKSAADLNEGADGEAPENKPSIMSRH